MSKYSLWGSKSARFKDWQEGDFLVFIVNKELAGFATVSGKPFQSTDLVWDNGIFPYRVPTKFVHVLKRDQRVPILGEVRDILTSSWGPSYGWGILTQSIIQDKQAETLTKIISVHPNALSQIESELPAFLAEAKHDRETVQKR